MNPTTEAAAARGADQAPIVRVPAGDAAAAAAPPIPNPAVREALGRVRAVLDGLTARLDALERGAALQNVGGDVTPAGDAWARRRTGDDLDALRNAISEAQREAYDLHRAFEAAVTREMVPALIGLRGALAPCIDQIGREEQRRAAAAGRERARTLRAAEYAREQDAAAAEERRKALGLLPGERLTEAGVQAADDDEDRDDDDDFAAFEAAQRATGGANVAESKPV